MIKYLEIYVNQKKLTLSQFLNFTLKHFYFSKNKLFTLSLNLFKGITNSGL